MMDRLVCVGLVGFAAAVGVVGDHWLGCCWGQAILISNPFGVVCAVLLLTRLHNLKKHLNVKILVYIF